MRSKKTEMERFWAQTKVVGSCLVWIGALSKHGGYGLFRVRRPDGSWLTVRAHRFLYKRIFGELPKTMEILHSCDVRRCIALQHLSPGTRQQNVEDAMQKDRHSRGERNGHARLTAQDVIEIRRRCASGEKQSAIARAFDTDQGTVSRIVNRKRWTSVT